MEENTVKKALSSILAILLALAMVAAFAACGGGKDDPTPTEPDDITTEEIITTEPDTEDVIATTAPDDDITTEEPATGDDATTVDGETAVDGADEFAPPANLNTLSKDEQLAYFNKVVNNVRTAKPGFKTDYLEELGKMEFTGVVSAVSGIIDSIKKQLMPGEWKYETVAKSADNKGKFMSENANASDLKVGDVASITSTKSGSNWVIKVNIVTETNPAKGTGSAHSRIMPIASRQEVLDSITDISSLISADVNDATLRYNSAYATVTVNEKGQVIAGEYFFKVDAKANNVKISFIGTNVTAPQSTKKIYHDFVW